MHLVLFILSAGVIASCLVTNKSGIDETVDRSETQLTRDDGEKAIVAEDADYAEDVDFDDSDDDFKGLLAPGNSGSLMHVHQENGEVLVPCFGMWWPMGGYTGGGYEYIDYYGDYRKKKRRSRKQKKAAKMKKKKS